jgi:MoxR-like ATPase
VLRHRVSANFQALAEGKNSDDLVAELLKVISEPEPAKYVARKRG